MPLNVAEATAEMRRLSGLLDGGLDVLRKAGIDLANLEAAYRRAKAEAWLTTPREDEDGKTILAKEREAEVDSVTAEYRKARDIAEAMRLAALESIRSRRAQLSAWQTLVSADKEEAAMSRQYSD